MQAVSGHLAAEIAAPEPAARMVMHTYGLTWILRHLGRKTDPEIPKNPGAVGHHQRNVGVCVCNTKRLLLSKSSCLQRNPPISGPGPGVLCLHWPSGVGVADMELDRKAQKA